jgi:8-oxo-dGTP pyrophosphatase MutT (NUDIX family)
MAEAGLHYSTGVYDLERYRRLHEIASELLAAQAEGFRWPVEIGYATPKVDIRAAVIEDGKILLVREAGTGTWSLPGGWADLNASPAENAAREVREEAGIEVEVLKLVACLPLYTNGRRTGGLARDGRVRIFCARCSSRPVPVPQCPSLCETCV